jgi:predicted Zn-dependent protease with MMP-like domain
MGMHWEELTRMADEVIEETLATLPPEIQVHARQLPLILEELPAADLQEEGLDQDILGLFVGESLEDRGASPSPLPGQILLFLSNIWDYAQEDPDEYREEVRLTLLHEIGHYFGWDEQDLFDRNLE